MKPDRWPPLLSAFSASCSASLRRFAEALRLAFRAAFFGDPVQLGLGALDLSEGGNVLTRIKRAFHEVAAHANEGAKQREVVDLSGKVAGADHRSTRSRQLGKVGRTADFLHPFVGFEQRLEGDGVGDAIAVGELEDGLVNAAVQRLEEMKRLQFELDVLDQAVVDHQRAEQGRFRLDVLRKGGIGSRSQSARRYAGLQP